MLNQVQNELLVIQNSHSKPQTLNVGIFLWGFGSSFWQAHLSHQNSCASIPFYPQTLNPEYHFPSPPHVRCINTTGPIQSTNLQQMGNGSPTRTLRTGVEGSWESGSLHTHPHILPIYTPIIVLYSPFSTSKTPIFREKIYLELRLENSLG